MVSGLTLLGGGRTTAAALDAVDVIGEQQLEAHQAGPQQHQLKHAKGLNQTIGHDRPDYRTERGAEADDDEQALAFLLRVHVVGEGPELRDDHQVEDADPDEIDHPERHAGLRQQIEDRRTDHEEDRDDVDQRHARKPGDETAVEGHHERQQHDLTGGQVALELGGALAEDQRLAHGLQDVVRHQDQEHVQREEQRRLRLSRPYHGEQVEEALESGRAGVFCHVCHSTCCHSTQCRTLRTMDQRGWRDVAFCPRIQCL